MAEPAMACLHKKIYMFLHMYHRQQTQSQRALLSSKVRCISQQAFSVKSLHSPCKCQLLCDDIYLLTLHRCNAYCLGNGQIISKKFGETTTFSWLPRLDDCKSLQSPEDNHSGNPSSSMLP